MFLQLRKKCCWSKGSFSSLSVVGCFDQESGDLDNDMQWSDITNKVQTKLEYNGWGTTTSSIKEHLFTLRGLLVLQIARICFFSEWFCPLSLVWMLNVTTLTSLANLIRVWSFFEWIIHLKLRQRKAYFSWDLCRSRYLSSQLYKPWLRTRQRVMLRCIKTRTILVCLHQSTDRILFLF